MPSAANALSRISCGNGQRTNLENRLRIRPAGVVSKKLIGARKMACAILSCNFREACNTHTDKIPSVSVSGPSRQCSTSDRMHVPQ